MRILAAFIFFTRLPFWRITSVPGDYFKNVVSGWAMTGWLTAGISAAVLYSSALVFPVSVAILLAIGGGSDKQKILSIMKDSHIGTYGVVGLVFYFLMLYTLLSSLPLDLAGCAILAADPFAKGVSSMIINRLPYARKEEDSKAKVVYSRMTPGEYLFSVVCGLFPLVWLPEIHYLWATFPVLLCWYFLTSFMKKKIGGYTGDCCGALTLLCELSFYMGIVFVYSVTH